MLFLHLYTYELIKCLFLNFSHMLCIYYLRKLKKFCICLLFFLTLSSYYFKLYVKMYICKQQILENYLLNGQKICDVKITLIINYLCEHIWSCMIIKMLVSEIQDGSWHNDRLQDIVWVRELKENLWTCRECLCLWVRDWKTGIPGQAASTTAKISPCAASSASETIPCFRDHTILKGRVAMTGNSALQGRSQIPPRTLKPLPRD